MHLDPPPEPRRGPRDEADLARKARDGDAAAFGRLVAAHSEIAFRVAYLFTASAGDAEDAAQEGFVKAYLALDRFDPGRPFRPWLLQIVANEARNRSRASSRRLAYETRSAHHPLTPMPGDEPEHAAEIEDVRRRLLAAVNALPEPERLVIGLRYFLQLSEAETAAAAGIPRGTVKSRLARALGRLRARDDLGDLR